MAVNSQPSAKPGKPNTGATGKGEARPLPRPARRREISITPDEALQILQSAVSYCQHAGIAVTYANGPEGLTLHLAGCVVHEEPPCFVLAEAVITSTLPAEAQTA